MYKMCKGVDQKKKKNKTWEGKDDVNINQGTDDKKISFKMNLKMLIKKKY